MKRIDKNSSTPRPMSLRNTLQALLGCMSPFAGKRACTKPATKVLATETTIWLLAIVGLVHFSALIAPAQSVPLTAASQDSSRGGAPQAVLSPSPLVFGLVGVGTTSSAKTVTLQNNLNSTLSITGITPSGDFVVSGTTCGVTLGALSKCQIFVTFTPKQLGVRSGKLTVVDSANNSPQTISIAGTGTLDSLISISVTPVNPTVPVEAKQQFTATGSFPGSILLNLTNLVYWSSSATGVATISNSLGSQGLATAKAAGTTKILATSLSKSGSTSLTVGTKAAATVSLSNLTQTYDGTPKSVTVTTVPSGLAVVVTYSGSTTVPANAGSYSVVAAVNDPNYQGTASGTLTINKAAATVNLSNLTQTYTGSALSPTVTTSPANLATSLTGAPDTNGGTYPVTATITNPNYTGSASGSFVITKAAATVTLNNLTQTYTGSPLSPTVITSPANLSTSLTGAPDTNASTYPVTATITDPNYTGSANGSFVVNPSMPAVVVTGGAFQFDGNPHPASASATGVGGASVAGNFAFTYNGSQNVPISTGTYAVDANFTSADPNYSNATGSGSITITAPALTLESIQVSPANSLIPHSGTQQLSAIGNYSDGSTQDLTATATWDSSNGEAAGVTSGMVTAASGGCGGPTIISAVVGSISGSANIMVANPDSFACAGQLQVARDPHTSTVLNNGQVLITGGFGSNGKAQDSAELYDPNPNRPHQPTTTLLQPIGGPRANHTATLLYNGSVLIAGGQDDLSNPLDSAVLFDPATNQFTPSTQRMAFARYNHTATLLPDGTVLIVGGTPNGTDELDSVEIYNPFTDQFYFPNCPTNTPTRPRQGHTATLLGPNAKYSNAVLIAGGLSSQSATNRVDIYDTYSQCILQQGQVVDNNGNSVRMNSARAQHTATLLPNGQGILFAGGMNDNVGVLDSAEIYHIGSSSFDPNVLTMNSPRAGHTATLLANASVLLAGGEDASYTAQGSAELFDLQNGFRSTAKLSTGPRTEQTASLLHCDCLQNGYVLLAGGQNDQRIPITALEFYAVSPPVVAALTVSPADLTVAVGTNVQFAASDSAGIIPIGPVTWTSSDPSVVISNDEATSGVAQALTISPGPVTIQACVGYGPSLACGQTTLQVVLHTVSYITVDPPMAYMLASLGATKKFNATAYYSDNTSGDVSNNVNWLSSDKSVASVDSSGNVTLTGIPGDITITATDPQNNQSYATLHVLGQSTSIGPRCCMGMVYVPVDQQGNGPYTLLFGGSINYTGRDVEGDTLMFNSTKGYWTPVNTAHSPAPRQGPGMAYDPATKKVVLFGGSQFTGTFDLNDTWVWDGSDWRQVSTSNAPDPRRWDTQGLAAFGSAGKVVLFGGYNSYGGAFADTWSFDTSLETWTLINAGPNGNPPHSPSPRRAPMAYDPGNNKIILFGGDGITAALDETWTWDDTNGWVLQVPLVSPPPRAMASLTYDSSIGHIVLFGGSGAGSTPPYYNDMWIWEGTTTWTEVFPSLAVPERYAFGMVYDPILGETVIYGGLDQGDTVVLSDQWLITP